jgi:hypothetical protein
MKKIILFLLIIFNLGFAQTFKAVHVNGDVKAQIGTNENWVKVSENSQLPANSIITTGKNSSVMLERNGIKFSLESYSALPLSSIKKMSINDLLLALAMEDMLNAPKKKEDVNTKNTAVYGAEINGVKTPMLQSDNFGIKRLNGAVQLAESGFNESAVIEAMVSFRKYPETKKMPAYRIYFANILYGLGLNEEAYDDFKSINSLQLSNEQKTEVQSKLEVLSKKLMKN